jgi:single-stranded-DNA-specific exonuclease
MILLDIRELLGVVHTRPVYRSRAVVQSFLMETSPYAELIETLLEKRGIRGALVQSFLEPDYARDTHDPFLMPDMERAVARLFSGLEAGERIAVYADFDCDGIPGAAILHDLLRKLGHVNFEVYIPHRDREGYGFHAEAVQELAARGTSLIVTVDVGVTAVDTVAFAKRLGVDVIVTDHHELGPLPEAFAILNPKIKGYPFPHLCGAGVAFKLAQAVMMEGRRRGDPRVVAVPLGWEKWLLDMVVLATVADMVPLVGENRTLAYWGLQVLRKSRRPGLTALFERLRLRQGELTEDDIGFSLAPRVNAASRMGEPERAFTLLTTADHNEAESLARELELLNARRKGIVSSVVREAKKRARERFAAGERVVVLGDTSWKPGLLGLVANSLVEERGGVVALWGRDARGTLKGSARSDGSVSVVELFRAAGVFEEYGGHENSGGFTVSHEKVHELPDSLARAARELGMRAEEGEGPVPDALITLREVSALLLREISRLAPFGTANPKPLFLVRDAHVSALKQFGKEKNHLDVELVCARTGVSARAFDFFRAPDDFTLPPSPGADVRVLATLGRDSFHGPKALALRIVDILPS